MPNTNIFIPDGALALLSPILKDVARWPEFGVQLPLPETTDERYPSRKAFDDLDYLVGAWLNASLRRGEFGLSCGFDDDGHLTARLGTTEQEWADSAPARAEYKKAHPKFIEPVRVEGFACATRHGSMPTFSFALGWARGMGALDAAALLARLRLVVPPALFDELMAPASTPEKHPSVNSPSGYAATAFLDRSGHGNIFPYLYLYASPDRLVGVFQQVPHVSL